MGMKPLKYALVVLISLAVLWVTAGVAYYYYVETQKSDIKKILGITLTLNDVYGELPPEPSQEINNATVAGVDSNNNHIRDDVERALREKYQHDEKLLAATLQYAQALQIFITLPKTGDEVAYAIGKESRGSGCIVVTMPIFTKEESALWLAGDKEMYRKGKELDAASNEVEQFVYKLVLNNERRINAHRDMYRLEPGGSASDHSKKYECDIFNDYSKE